MPSVFKRYCCARAEGPRKARWSEGTACEHPDPYGRGVHHCWWQQTTEERVPPAPAPPAARHLHTSPRPQTPALCPTRQGRQAVRALVLEHAPAAAAVAPHHQRHAQQHDGVGPVGQQVVLRDERPPVPAGAGAGAGAVCVLALQALQPLLVAPCVLRVPTRKVQKVRP